MYGLKLVPSKLKPIPSKIKNGFLIELLFEELGELFELLAEFA